MQNVVSINGGQVHEQHRGITGLVFPQCRTGSQTNMGITYTQTDQQLTCSRCVENRRRWAAREAAQQAEQSEQLTDEPSEPAAVLPEITREQAERLVDAADRFASTSAAVPELFTDLIPELQVGDTITAAYRGGSRSPRGGETGEIIRFARDGRPVIMVRENGRVPRELYVPLADVRRHYTGEQLVARYERGRDLVAAARELLREDRDAVRETFGQFPVTGQLLAEEDAERAPEDRPTVVVPCSAAKQTTVSDAPLPACELYTGPLFRSAYAAAQAMVARGEAGRIAILSARHGLVHPGWPLESYDVKMGDPGSVTPGELAEQLAGAGELLPLLPKQYDAALREAAQLLGAGEQVRVNPLAGSRGLLEMRSRLTRIRTGGQPQGFEDGTVTVRDRVYPARRYPNGRVFRNRRQDGTGAVVNADPELFVPYEPVPEPEPAPVSSCPGCTAERELVGLLALDSAAFEARFIADHASGPDRLDWPGHHLTADQLAQVYPPVNTLPLGKALVSATVDRYAGYVISHPDKDGAGGGERVPINWPETYVQQAPTSVGEAYDVARSFGPPPRDRTEGLI